MWQGIYGHDDVVERFRRSLAAGRLASTFLLVGPSGIGKRAFAGALAKALLCQQPGGGALDPCGVCHSCKLADAGNHPDVLTVAKPEGKSAIPVELLIGSGERRMREGLCHDIGMKPFLGGRRVAIIDDADDLNLEGANCLLKTLEEPPPNSIILLIGTSAAQQLPTIRSRCQIVRFKSLADDVLTDLLIQHGVVGSRDEAARLLPLAEGSFQRAVCLADPAVAAFRGQLLNHFAAVPVDAALVAKLIQAFLEEAGREPARRRERLRLAIGFAVEFYRELMRTLAGAPPAEDAELSSAASRAAADWPGDAQLCAQCLDRSLEALRHISRNANQATLLECWLDDLCRDVASQSVAS